MNLPESIKIENEEAREAFKEGYRLQMSGEFDRAIDYYERSITIEETAEGHTFLGWALSHQDRLDEAIQECRKAISIDPEFGNPYNDIGVYRLKKGDLKGAKIWFERALEAPRYDSYCFPHFNLGRIFRMRGNFSEALQQFEKALDEEPDFEKAEKAKKRIQYRFN